ncbi:hypothetical protein LguiA_034118 [Lonicera macranthoides]
MKPIGDAGPVIEASGIFVYAGKTGMIPSQTAWKPEVGMFGQSRGLLLFLILRYLISVNKGVQLERELELSGELCST